MLMRKHLLTVIVILCGWNAIAQTNTFPPSGNAGIGTLTPLSNLDINAAAPEQRFITSADGSFARFLRSTASLNNLFTGKNKLLQAGGISKCINMIGSSYATASDAGLPSGTSPNMTISFWVYANNVPGNIGSNADPIIKWGSGSTEFSIGWFNNTIRMLDGNGNQYWTGGGPATVGTWTHFVFIFNGTSLSQYKNGNLTTGTVSWNIATNGTMQIGDVSGNGNFYLDQLLIYNTALTGAQALDIYHSGFGTGDPVTTGLIRRYDFEDGPGNTAIDANPNTTPYNLILHNSPVLQISSIVPNPTASVDATFFSVSDGLTNAEKGIISWGDANGRNQQQGKWFQWQQGSNYPLVSNNAGRWLFNPNNTSTSLPTVASTIDVAGNVTVGSAYAGTNAAPTNGLIVQGNTGIGTPAPAYPLQINQPLNGQGTISVSAGSGAVTGTGTKFLADFNVGDTIKAHSEIRIISAIASNTSMTTNNWTSTFNGAYTTTNAQRFSFGGNGNFYIGDAPIPGTLDPLLSVGKIYSYNTTPITAPSATGIRAFMRINSTNTQNWTGLIGVNSTPRIMSGASGTVNQLAGVNSTAANGSPTALVTTLSAYSGAANNSGGLTTNAYFSKGAVQCLFGTGSISNAYLYAGNFLNNPGGTITNSSGLFLTGMASATNNTGVYLSNAATTNIPAGNWAVYDTTGYKSYFAGNIGIGTTDPKGYKLAVNGSVIATSVNVKAYANWPDYVFNTQHALMPLSDLKAYVDKNKHLPEIPSAAEVEKNGQDLGEMNKLLVKKMEEMTLYMIEKDKEIKELQKQVAEIKNNKQ